MVASSRHEPHTCHHQSNEICQFIEGSTTKTIAIDKNIKSCEIKADIIVSKRRCIRLWGQVKDSHDQPIPYVLVKLVKEIRSSRGTDFESVAHGVTDWMGFYQFDLYTPYGHEINKYRVIASKPTLGKEFSGKDLQGDSCDDDSKCVK